MQHSDLFDSMEAFTAEADRSSRSLKLVAVFGSHPSECLCRKKKCCKKYKKKGKHCKSCPKR